MSMAADSSIKQKFIDLIKSGLFSFSFYSPLVVIIVVMYWGFSINAPIKSFIYFLVVIVLIAFRVVWFSSLKLPPSGETVSGTTISPPLCSNALTLPNDPTFSMFILSFTFFYLLLPMILQSSSSGQGTYNFGAIGFFSSYLIYDLIIKGSLGCIEYYQAIFSVIIGGIIGTLFGFLFYNTARSYTYINNTNTSTGQTCNMPSKQQFKCRLYKNGELVSSSMSSE